jgi:hypothetical protein
MIAQEKSSELFTAFFLGNFGENNGNVYRLTKSIRRNPAEIIVKVGRFGPFGHAF